MTQKKGGGKHGGGKAGTKQSVGRALIRRHQGFGPRGTGPLPKPDHGAAAAGGGGEARPVLSSVLEMNSLDDFLETALMAQRDFAAIKERDLLIIDAKGGVPGAVLPPGGQGLGQGQQKKKAATTGLAFRQLKVCAWRVCLCVYGRMPPRGPPPPPYIHTPT